MTKKDYIVLADIIKRAYRRSESPSETVTVSVLMEDMIVELTKGNDRFDRDKFIAYIEK